MACKSRGTARFEFVFLGNSNTTLEKKNHSPFNRPIYIRQHTMVVRLRLARYGRRNLPYYSIVAANAKTARNAKPLETIGTYNPIPDSQGIKHVNLNIERVKYWLTVGAQPSETVERLLSKV